MKGKSVIVFQEEAFQLPTSAQCRGMIENINCSQTNTTGLRWCYVNTGSDNDLVPDGTKPLPEPVLTKFYAVIWRHPVLMS